MKTEQAVFCRWVTSTDDSGKPVTYCSTMVSRKAQIGAGERMGLGRPVGLLLCKEHLDRFPFWP